MTKDMLTAHMPAPSDNTLILVCGPPVFSDLMEKLLKELGYTADMVFRF